jgi:hypothetical protein
MRQAAKGEKYRLVMTLVAVDYVSGRTAGIRRHCDDPVAAGRPGAELHPCPRARLLNKEDIHGACKALAKLLAQRDSSGPWVRFLLRPEYLAPKFIFQPSTAQ